MIFMNPMLFPLLMINFYSRFDPMRIVTAVKKSRNNTKPCDMKYYCSMFGEICSNCREYRYQNMEE